MKIGLLGRHPEAHNYRRLIDVGKKRGHVIRLIQLSYCYMNISAVAPTVYYRNNETLEDLDAIIPHITSRHTFYGTAVLRQFEMMNVFTVNNSLSVTWSKDKLRALQILAKKGLSLPITGFADSPEETEKLIDVVGGAPLIVRLLEGTQGKGTIFASTHQAALSVINAFKQLKTNILVQEFIQESEGTDIRCLVIGNKVVTSIERKKSQEKPIQITPEEERMAIQAAEALKLNFANIDIIRSNRGPLILDIDCSPNIEFFEKITSLDIASPLFQFIEETAKKHD